MEEITKAIDRGDSVDVIYLDFKKAFVKVSHQRLLIKLQGYGIQGKHYGGYRNFSQTASKELL